MNNFGSSSILAVVLAINLMSCASTKSSELLTQLATPATTEGARNELINKCKYDAGLQAEIARALPLMLSQAPDGTVMESEAKLAGALKIASTAPELVHLLGHRNMNPNYLNGGLTSSFELRGDPVAHALYEIGPPAYPALAEALSSPDKEKRTRALSVLMLALDDHNKEARHILTDHLSVEPDPHLRIYIASNLEAPATK